MNDTEVLIVKHDDALTFLTINRPRALNALNEAVIMALGGALDELPESTRVVVITGAGDKAFIAGADIKSMSVMDAHEAHIFSTRLHQLGNKIASLPVPVIAAVNGFALGGGCELMLACDFALAATGARFGQPEVGLGVIPAFGGTTRLSRRVGDAQARQLVFTGVHFDAAEALRLGLVNEVIPGDRLQARVREVAQQIAANAPRAVAYAKRSLHHGTETDLMSANDYEAHLFGLCFATEDQTEGMTAFIEKRSADWKGV
ncbi:MAG: enoyl-CoA hydratase/isomerase family protein [Myxococcales bacterium]|nr:enoyl-CoA hydratase/isomerase family protein [Myxococcales bacterium]